MGMDTTGRNVLSTSDIASDDELWEAYGAALHIDKYPEGCREPGHSCDTCAAMTGVPHHEVASRRVGRQMGVRLGTVEYRCLEPGCKAEI
jgi:hypothetical protein